jgi:hypothetical protein
MNKRAGEAWLLDNGDWAAWINRFPNYTLADRRIFSDWRRKVELAALQPFPQAPLSVDDRRTILEALTEHAGRLEDRARTASTATVMLAGASAITAVGAILLHPLVPIAAALAAVAAAKVTYDGGFGASAGNEAVHGLLVDIAERLP